MTGSPEDIRLSRLQRAAVACLRFVLPDDEARDPQIGDLIEEFRNRAEADGVGKARRRFLRQAGSVGLYALRDRLVDALRRDGSRSRTGDGKMTKWWGDLRVAVRSLSRAPGFTVVAVLTLGVGIGANTAIFSAVDGVLLEPLDFPDADALVDVRHTAPGFDFDEVPLSEDTYALIKSENRVFSGIGATRDRGTANLTGDHEPLVLEVIAVSWDLPRVLGMTLPLGRSFTQDEDVPGGPDVAVLSHGLWEETFGADPSILGRTIQLDGAPVEVVGVLPQRLDVPSLDGDLWVPIRIDPEAPVVGAFGLDAIARLQPGRTPEIAEANMAPIIEILAENNAEAQNYLSFIRNGRLATLVRPLKSQIVGDLEAPLWILLGTVGFVLLIACANVANLVLVRTEARQKEIAVRAAMGAGRGTVMRGFLAESVVLAVAGGVLGVLLAAVGLPALLTLTPESLPRGEGVGIDVRVLGFTSLLVVFSALFFGMAPASRAFTPDMFGALKHARGSTDGKDRHRLRNVLVAGQTALALMLLIGSGLMLRSFGELRNVDPGFDPKGVLTFGLSLPEAVYDTPRAAADFHQRLAERLTALPGVTSAGAAEFVPLTGEGQGMGHRAEDLPVEPGQLPPIMFYKTVMPGFFETMGSELVAGRQLERADHEQQLPHVVINQAAAERLWPGQDALNRRIGPISSDSVPTWYTVVGVVEDVLEQGLTEPARGHVYYPAVAPDETSISGAQSMTYVLRTEGDPMALAGPARDAVWAVDANIPLTSVQEMQTIVSDSEARMSFTMISLGVAAAVALMLGAIGLYGVLSYVVAQRTREIGVRIALGAEGRSVRSMVVRQGLVVASAGLLVGLVGALALSRVMEGLLYGTSVRDPVTFTVTSLVLLLVGALASYLPARRASAIDPMEALRAE